MKTQKQYILESDAPTHICSDGTVYKGSAPEYTPIIDPISKMVVGYKKSKAGVPFINVTKLAEEK